MISYEFFKVMVFIVLLTAGIIATAAWTSYEQTPKKKKSLR